MQAAALSAVVGDEEPRQCCAMVDSVVVSGELGSPVLLSPRGKVDERKVKADSSAGPTGTNGTATALP